MTELKISMPIVDLDGIAHELGEAGRRVRVLWQEGESLAFVARGREYRSEFHINPSDEVMFMIRGQMNLHYRNPDGTEDVAVIPQGSSIYTRSGIPHSPRFPPDAFVLVIERLRRPGELDRFHWFCRKCDNFLHEEAVHVDDYRTDPVGKAYQRFFADVDARTCGECGDVMPAG
ncbi:3-hydroxyanthranilate 3,4-dioxygenase [Pseudonocardia thermophila]|uniref:3-hydroxyanthranilate 3,4-dioxygenase n=1 Tax=Pseudonocardia thermophila TaxID=1848 RepID=A0A1M6UML7_PSETH|nr:3-hydroxybutyryl-CoA dehydratase [Pseudonocardia thermophila]SHK70464.1 3-hydroxyanthranilate 3,4-dioxygenase [Pseudonocardia thermophila]